MASKIKVRSIARPTNGDGDVATLVDPHSKTRGHDVSSEANDAVLLPHSAFPLN